MTVLKGKYLIVALCLLFLGNEMIGQSRNIIGPNTWSKPHTTKKKNNRVDALAKLAKSITANAHSDEEKIAAIYRWIATSITYDNQLRISGKLQKKIYVSEDNVVQKVLERKMALCGGYAFLFRDLCEKVNIQAKAIDGYTKDYTGKIHDYKTPNHTWNAVKLNGTWKLLDITWAVGYGNKNNPDNFWYFTNPSEFIYSHYPENPEWTLLGDSVSFAEFRNR